MFSIFFTNMFILVFVINRQRKVIQIEDGTYVKRQQRISEKTNRQIYGSFSGAIFGSLLWLHLMCINAKDWMTMRTVLAVGILIFWIASKICLRNRKLYNRVALAMFTAIGLVNFIVVNLRWNQWMEYSIQTRRHFKYTHISLSTVNLIIAAAIAGVLIVFLICDLVQRLKRRNQNHEV